MRRGLLLQLEELRATYPFLHFSPDVERNKNISQTLPSTIPSYQDVIEHQNANSYRMSARSSGSTHYSDTGGSNSSSTGSSGDGIVTIPNQTNSIMPTRPESYEEFEEFEEIETLQTCSNLTASTARGLTPIPPRLQSLDYVRGEHADDRDEDSYAEDIEAVPFRILVGKCDFHGILSRRSRGLLPGIRNSKVFLCVLAGPLLYLYQKEGDDKQKKVIELTGYNVQETHVDDQKVNSKRKDFAFQLIGPAKKTHVFFTSKKALMDRWMVFIKRAIAEGSSLALNGDCALSKGAMTKIHEDSLRRENGDLCDDYEEDVYEELGPEEAPAEYFPSPPALPISNYQAHFLQTALEDTSEYYSFEISPQQKGPTGMFSCLLEAVVDYILPKNKVPEEIEESLLSQLSSTKQKQFLFLPERASLPTLARPLPDAPSKHRNTLDDDESVYDDIYCEIDEPELPESSPVDYFNNLTSLSKDIFEAIKNRAHAKAHDHWEGSDYDRHDEPTDDKLSIHTSAFLPKTPNLSSTISKFPSKILSANELGSDESNYKVPSSMAVKNEQLYQTPRVNPPRVPWADDFQSRGSKCINLDMQQVAEKDLADTPVAEEEGRVEQIFDSSMKGRCLGQKGQLHTNSTSVNPSTVLSQPNPNATPTRKISSSSVKDLIAKINKTDQFAETSHSSILAHASCKKIQNVMANFDKSSVVENKIILGISRNIGQIKTAEEKTEKQDQTQREIKSGNLELQVNSPTTPDAPSINRNSKEILYDNCESKGANSESTEDLEWPAMYIAKFAFVSNKLGDLSFNRGDEILIKENPGDAKMWSGILREQEGFVLRNYLRRKDPS